MNLLFNITYIIWLITEIVINRALRSGNTDKQNADKNSLAIIWVVIILSVTGAVFISVDYALPISANESIRYAGLAIIFIGIALRIVAVKMLGKFFTADVTIREGHQLIKKGFYKYFRHPSYTASLLTFIGFGISLNNWASLGLVFIAIIIAFLIRIKIEEKALITQFGDQYLAYKKEAYGLIPFIY